MRKFQKEKNNYKNNRGLFWELENGIMGRKKRNNVLRPTQHAVPLCSSTINQLRFSTVEFCLLQDICCTTGPPLIIHFNA